MVSRFLSSWAQLGSVLRSKYDGSSLNMVIRANNSASALVELITSELPGESNVGGRQVSSSLVISYTRLGLVYMNHGLTRFPRRGGLLWYASVSL